MNPRRKRPAGRRLIKRYEHGGPHPVTSDSTSTSTVVGDPTPEELRGIRDFYTRRQQNVSKDAMDFLNRFYSQPSVRQKIAENLATTPGEGPAPEPKETATYKTLARMYPNRIDEMSTYEGLANVVADHYGDFSASMGNFTFGFDPDRRTRGFVDYFADEDFDPEASTRNPNTPRSRSGAGRVTKPFVMGMRPFQERMNLQVQVDPYAPTSTYIHELTHAADIMNNPGNAALMNKYRKKLNPKMDTEEFQRNFEALGMEGKKVGMQPAEFLAYVGMPTETLARLNAIRYDMIEDNRYRGIEANPMDYEYAYDDIPALMKHGSFGEGKAFKQLAAVYGAENVVEMLNEIY